MLSQPIIRIPCVCRRCGVPFSITPGDLRKGQGKHCSLACYRAYTVQDRYWSKVVKADSCWGWTGATVLGYAVLWVKDQNQRISRLAWEMVTGDTLTRADHILHTCDNRACSKHDDAGIYEVRGVILPRRGHLAKGTHVDNMADMIQKGRSLTGASNPCHRYEGHSQGERNGGVKLSEAQVLEIRARWQPFVMTQKMLAAEYSVSESTIQRITLRKTWAHLQRFTEHRQAADLE